MENFRKHILFSFLGALAILVSCTKEVKIEIPGYKEQLVVDGFIETGSPAFVLLSKTNNIYAGTNIQNYIDGFVSGATVIVSDGTIVDTLLEVCTNNLPQGTEETVAALLGLSVDQILSTPICFYVSDQIIGEVGKTYDLKIIHQGKIHEAKSAILPAKQLDSLYWKPENGLPQYGFSWAKLTDPPQSGNAYKWEVKYVSSPGFSKPFNPFTDDRFYNGLSFDFAYENPMSFNDPNISDEQRGYFKLGDTIVVKFSTLGKKEFQFFEKKYNQIFSAGNPFSTPVNIPSNVSNGALGIWVGFSPTYDTLICTP
jgi:hypothetical protein